VDEHQRFPGPTIDIVQLDSIDMDFVQFHRCIRRHGQALLSFLGSEIPTYATGLGYVSRMLGVRRGG
jgi:hypothetical protein